MKIRKLIIKNYKIFDDVEFDFTDGEGNTLDTVVLAGVNGCGKTTVLEAIGQVFVGLLSEDKSEIVCTFDMMASELEVIRSKIPPPPFSPIGTRTVSPPIWRKVKKNFLWFSSRGEYQDSLQYFASLIEPSKVIYLPINQNYSQQVSSEKLQVIEMSRQKRDLKNMTLRKLRDEVFKNKDLPPKQAIENQIKNITRALSGLDLNTRLVDLESEELVFESANGQRIYFEQLSHGEQHLYFRAIYLSQLNLKDSIIMVDEPEAAFHPTWQQKIAQLYRNVGENNQVFMATHSPHIMASVPPECLFVLHIEESEGKRKIRVVNAAKAGLYSQGLEPNRILKEVMQVETLRDWETQRDIERLTVLLTPEQFDGPEAEELAEKLTAQLGRQEPFIIRLEHQMLMLRRKKENHAPAYAAA